MNKKKVSTIELFHPNEVSKTIFRNWTRQLVAVYVQTQFSNQIFEKLISLRLLRYDIAQRRRETERINTEQIPKYT